MSDTVSPSIPTNIISTAKTATSVSLSWSPSTDNIGTGTTKPESNADVTLLVTGGKTVNIAFDYTGTIKAGQLPLNVAFKALNAASADITTSASWAGVLKTGTATFTPTAGSPNATGFLNITAMSADAVIEMQATYSSKVRKDNVTLLRLVDPPPGTGSGSGTSDSTSSITSTTASTYGTANTRVLSCKAGTGGKVDLTFPDSFDKATTGTGDCHGKWQWRVVSGTFADVTTEIASSVSSVNHAASGGDPAYTDSGTLTCTMQKTGLTSGTTYEFQLLLRSDGTYDLYHTGTATAVGS